MAKSCALSRYGQMGIALTLVSAWAGSAIGGEAMGRCEDGRASGASCSVSAGPMPVQASFVKLSTIHFSGNSLFSEAELLTVIGFEPNDAFTLAGLQALTDKVTDHYRRNGYAFAKAYLPEQETSSTAITIVVSEGRYGEIRVQNGPDIPTATIRGTLGSIRAGSVIDLPELEEKLLLLSDMAGLRFTSRLEPGDSPGTSNLIIDVVRTNTFAGDIDIDDSGNQYTGRNRAGIALTVNNVSGLADIASFRVLSSGGGLAYGRLAYQIPIERFKLGLEASKLHYALGQDFSALQASGTARTLGASSTVSTLRTQSEDAALQFGVAFKTLKDDVGALQSSEAKSARQLTAGFTVDRRTDDSKGSFSLIALLGGLRLDAGSPSVRDAEGPQTAGHYEKLNASFVLTRRVDATSAVSLSLSGQLASKNLDSSEKFAIGGPSGVRAIPEGEGYGDEGYLGSLEVVRSLSDFPIPGQLQLQAFVDRGAVKINAMPWTPGANSLARTGAGLGLTWTLASRFSAKLILARRLGSISSTAQNASRYREFFQLAAWF